MQQSIHVWIAGGIFLCSLVMTGSTQAQIIPDATLPQNSNVVLQGNTNVISGGTIAGSNLFHSFEQFSLATGGTAYFNNASEIQNIISRVTGSSISNIDGLIQANGTANLFLLNSNGIVLGPNASLNIGGSFLASTASHLNFADNTQFGPATQTTPLLTVNVPTGLQFGQTMGTILSQSQTGNQGSPGLRVQPGKTLALVGGNVNLDGGTLQAPDGRIELGGVSGAGVVGLTSDGNNFSLSFPDDIARADISLVNGALVDASGEFGGDIQVEGRRISLTDGSQMVIETLGSEAQGTLALNASESIELAEASGLLTGATDATGTGSDLTITTEQLSVQDSAISTNTVLTGEGESQRSITGRGAAGDLVVTATESVELIGTSADDRPSGLFTQALDDNDAGDLMIKTGELIVQDGAQVDAGTAGTGSGGTLTVMAESVELVGTAADGQPSRLSTTAEGAGDAGDLTITTENLVVQDQAQIAVSSEGSGDAGNVKVVADSIQLGNQAKLTAQSKSAAGGNITLQTQNLLLLRNNSLISTQAGGTGSDGNIDISANVILAVPSENSDIIATAVESKGGNIKVKAKGLLGPQFPKQLTVRSDIVATGTITVEDVVTDVRTPDVLPVKVVDVGGLVVPGCQADTDVSSSEVSEFTNTGRGGLPPTPSEVLRSSSPLVDLGTPIQGQATRARVAVATNLIDPKPTPVVEAQGWMIGKGGEVVLTAQAHTGSPHSPWLTAAACTASSTAL